MSRSTPIRVSGLLLVAAIGMPAQGARAFLISANANGTIVSSQETGEPAVFAERQLPDARAVDAAAATDLRSGSVSAAIVVESQSLLSDCCSIDGFAASAVLDDELIIGATGGVTEGSLTVTVSGVGSADASQLPGPPNDFSWGSFRFTLNANRNDSPDAIGSYASDSRQAAPQLIATDLPNLIDVATTGDSRGGSIVMTTAVQPGDRVDFRMTGGASAWSSRPDGAFGNAGLASATIRVDVSPGITWTSESGLLLAPEASAIETGGIAMTALAALALHARPPKRRRELRQVALRELR